MDVKMKITVSLIITCVVMSLLWHKLCEMEGFQPITPVSVKEIPRVSTLLSLKNRAWGWCMVCNAVLKTNYRSFSYGLQNAEELVQRLSRALDTDIRFSNCRPKHFNKSTYHFLMQWLSSTKIPHKFHRQAAWILWYHNCNTWWWTCLNLAKKVPTERSSLENNRFP